MARREKRPRFDTAAVADVEIARRPVVAAELKEPAEQPATYREDRAATIHVYFRGVRARLEGREDIGAMSVDATALANVDRCPAAREQRSVCGDIEHRTRPFDREPGDGVVAADDDLRSV